MKNTSFINMVTVVSAMVFILSGSPALAAMDHSSHGMGGGKGGGMGGHNMDASEKSPAAQVFSTKGVIQEIAGSKITIAHDAVAALRWPAMVMRFTVESVDLLDGFKVGDKISFDFRQQGSDFIIVGME
ncbi:MAG: copper-binding protein [Deltaproteobacteria bacterium]|nr:copper-binding protein [Deltaproteobacteria bacterium]